MTTEQGKKATNDKLNKALEQTFPGSDPIADNVVDKEAVRPEHRRPAQIDEKLVEELAKKVEEKVKQ